MWFDHQPASLPIPCRHFSTDVLRATREQMARVSNGQHPPAAWAAWPGNNMSPASPNALPNQEAKTVPQSHTIWSEKRRCPWANTRVGVGNKFVILFVLQVLHKPHGHVNVLICVVFGVFIWVCASQPIYYTCVGGLALTFTNILSYRCSEM